MHIDYYLTESREETDRAIRRIMLKHQRVTPTEQLLSICAALAIAFVAAFVIPRNFSESFDAMQLAATSLVDGIGYAPGLRPAVACLLTALVTAAVAAAIESTDAPTRKARGQHCIPVNEIALVTTLGMIAVFFQILDSTSSGAIIGFFALLHVMTRKPHSTGCDTEKARSEGREQDADVRKPPSGPVAEILLVTLAGLAIQTIPMMMHASRVDDGSVEPQITSPSFALANPLSDPFLILGWNW